jgi:Protein of unknown function (DUF642)
LTKDSLGGIVDQPMYIDGRAAATKRSLAITALVLFAVAAVDVWRVTHHASTHLLPEQPAIIANQSRGKAALLLSLFSGSPGPFANGSFEAGYAHWTAEGDQGILTNDRTHIASEGSSVAVFNGGLGSDHHPSPGGVLAQTFATIPGQRYSLAFDLGTVGEIVDQYLHLSVEGNGRLIDETILIAPIDAKLFYREERFSFVANSSITTLRFRDNSFGPYVIDMLLDNITVTPERADAPLITSPPRSVVVGRGRSATFSVTASGQNLRYQWRFGGRDIPGETKSSYTVAAADPARAGNYGVVVSNDAGSVSSSGATLFVLPPDIVLNGSFELGSAGWWFSDPNDVSSSINPIYVPSDGTHIVHFNFGQRQPRGAVSQKITTEPGQRYTLSFDLGAFSAANKNEQRMRLKVQGAATLISETLALAAPGNGTTWVPETFTFVADSPVTTLLFEDCSATTLNVDLILDRVRVTLNGTSVPSRPR